jgi:hypothetical protein
MDKLKRIIKSYSFVLLLLSLSLSGQEDKKLKVSGYLKFLSNYSVANSNFFGPSYSTSDLQTFDYLLHNRLNFKYRTNDSWSFALSTRNRLFAGSQLKSGAHFFNSLEDDAGLVDLNFFYGRSPKLALHTSIDRLYGQWENDKWIIRLGRQRINWGVNTVWNPNDIFNQYNYFDFDYEERLGSDALRLQYSPTFNTSWEFVFAPATQFQNSSSAILYKFNRWQYDWQFLSGIYQQDLVIGGALAGGLGNVGFKAEYNYYAPFDDDTPAFVFSTALDYIFKNGLYLQSSYLFNQEGGEEASFLDFSMLGADNVMSPRNLFLFKHTIFISANYSINPLFSISLGTMFSPDFSNLILYPSFTYSLGNNLDLLLTFQAFSTTNSLQGNNLDWLSASSFLRLKWSF